MPDHRSFNRFAGDPLLIPAKNGIQLGDGGLGSLLYASELPAGEPPERWLIQNPEQVRSAHAAFVEAGAQWLLTNTFGANRPRLVASGIAIPAPELNRIAVECARAGSTGVPVIGSMGPTGSDHPDTWTTAYTEQARALVVAGTDALLVETILRVDEGLYAIRAAVECGAKSVWASFTPGPDGRLLDGTSPEAAVGAFLRAGAAVIGANCGSGPESLLEPIRRLLDTGLAPVLAMPSAGLPVGEPPSACYPVSPDAFAEAAIQFGNMGVRYFAGCCGVGPDHLRAAAQRLAHTASGD
jgi:methionine synthase I (cobalamin-dependent)